jgi:heat shock protein HslJ
MNFRFFAAAAGAAFLLSACNQAPNEPNAPEPSLVGPTWILRSLHFGTLSATVTPSYYTLHFTDSGIVHGLVSCNQFAASYEATASIVRVTESIGLTRIACDEDPFSDEMLDVLDTTAHYTIRDSTLCLSVDNRKACFRTH